ncbi:MAG: DNA mismatch repair protein MutS [Treponema sp.]|nr:MAG: DNA mismatch repair protein MutS [Treponema sp.]
MSFADILEQWERQTAKPYGKKKLAKDKRLQKQSDTNAKAQQQDANRINPQELWMRRHGIIDKDSLAEKNHQGEKSPAGKKRLQKIPPDDTIDLHGMTCEDAEVALRGFFHKAIANKFYKILIIHGKGNHSKNGAVLAPFVKQFLENHKNAGETGHPKHADGGTGSTWVILK